MKRRLFVRAAGLVVHGTLLAFVTSFYAQAAPPLRLTPWSLKPFTIPARASCKQVSSCEEAVALWCNGYARADGDGDGVPCENVCGSRQEVEEIEAQIGCDN